MMLTEETPVVSEVDLVIRSSRVVTPDRVGPAAVAVEDGSIVAILDRSAVVPTRREIDVGGDALLPGLVDTHVHVGEPGRAEFEDFGTATRAAAAGGVTTMLVMPIGSVPPTVDVSALEERRGVAAGRCHIDVGFWGGAVAGNRNKLGPMHEAGVFGFKCFMAGHAAEFPVLSPGELHLVLRDMAELDDALLIAHAEDDAVLAAAPKAKGPQYANYLASAPPSAEVVAITRLVEAARVSGARVHVVHLSTIQALPVIAAARRDGVRISVETCPHYLAFAAETIPDGATPFKCSPPVREGANREELWRALAGRQIDFIVSDHSASTASAKSLETGDFDRAWPGISSLQLGLPVIWTEAAKRGHTLADIARWMAAEPARLASLRRKGAIAVGMDADLVRFRPDESFTVDPAALFHRNPITAYAGRKLDGVVLTTWLGGVEVGGRPNGRLIKRGEA